jgi:xanthine dehydrogenase accessory factor
MFDLRALQAAVAARGRVARVVIASVAGSSPREVGAAMLVWDGGQSGTIGGGALEWQAAAAARVMLAAGGARVSKHALGPDLGQCCGGAVSLVTEVFDAAALDRLAVLDGGTLRRVAGDAPVPLAVTRALARARDRGTVPGLLLADGWVLEPVAVPSRALWVWGAGHVGRAIVGVLAPLPGLALTWVDTDAARFPDHIPDGVAQRVAPDPGALVGDSPRDAEHLILTYSHAIDLDLCHRLLGHGFSACGLIGSATKWARFRARLAALGHAPGEIARIRCPIGAPSLGKHPQAIAIGVAADILSHAPALTRKATA